MRPEQGDLPLIKAGLIDRIGEVCAKLLPRGREESGQWVAHNPRGDDERKTPAFKVRLRGGAIGAWIDWRSGDKGDALDLVAHCLATDRKGALAWGRDFLGLRAMSRADREAMRQVQAERKKQADKEEGRRRARKLLDADRLFSARPGHADTAHCPQGTSAFGAGTQAEKHAKAYFAARAVPLDGPAIAAAAWYNLRFSPATEWWKGAQWERDGERAYKAERGPLFPAVHAAMRNALGIVTACHVTFLDPTRPAKAPVTPPKLMTGEAKGAVIELSTGPSTIPFWMADRDGFAPGPLVLAEGIETALAFATSVPQARVWAGGSLSGVMNAPVALPCIDWVLFARDNNDGNSQAQRQFDQALAALEASGKRVVVAASHVGDDFNDLARGAS